VVGDGDGLGLAGALKQSRRTLRTRLLLVSAMMADVPPGPKSTVTGPSSCVCAGSLGTKVDPQPLPATRRSLPVAASTSQTVHWP
jgi:hypothetical protein